MKKEYQAVAIFTNNREMHLHRTKPIYTLEEAMEEIYSYLNHENRLRDNDDFQDFIECRVRVREVSNWKRIY